MLRSLLTCVLLLASSSLYAARRVSTADNLLQAFANQCPWTVGKQTRRAMGHADVLMEIIKNIRMDECADWANGLRDLVAAKGPQLVLPSEVVTSTKLESEVSSLRQALSTETDINVRALIASHLAQKQVELYELGKNRNQQLWHDRARLIETYDHFASALAMRVRSNARCMNQYPQAISELGGAVLSMSGDFNIWGTIAGAGLMAVGTTSNLILSIVRGSLFAGTLRRLEYIRLEQGFSCALEVLNTNYCETQDTLTRIGQAISTNLDIYNSSWKGLKLMREFPLFARWLESAIAGTSPSSGDAASRIIQARQLRTEFFNKISLISGTMTETKRKIDSTNDMNRKNQLIEKLISTLSYLAGPHTHSSNGSTSPSPYYNFFLRDLDCGAKAYFFTGNPLAALDRNSNGQSISCNDYINLQLRDGNFVIPEFSDLTTRMNDLNDQARADVDFEYFRALEIDAERVVAQGHIRPRNERNNPFGVLEDAKRYLATVAYLYPQELEEAHLAEYLSNTLETLDQALCKLIPDTYCPASSDHHDKENDDLPPVVSIDSDPNIAVLSEVAKLLAPQDSFTYLSRRIRDIINFEIRMRLNVGDGQDHIPLPVSIQELLLLSSNDELDTLNDFTGFSLHQKKSDLEKALMAEEVNINSLMEIYGFKLRRIFSLLEDLGSESNLDKFCISLLGIPDIQTTLRKSRALKYCQGRKLSFDRYPDRLYVDFDKWVNKSHKDRMCQLFNFRKRIKIYESFGNLDDL